MIISNTEAGRRAALARLLPFYEYGEERFFCSDGAPADIADRRRAEPAENSIPANAHVQH